MKGGSGQASSGAPRPEHIVAAIILRVSLWPMAPRAQANLLADIQTDTPQRAAAVRRESAARLFPSGTIAPWCSRPNSQGGAPFL